MSCVLQSQYQDPRHQKHLDHYDVHHLHHRQYLSVLCRHLHHLLLRLLHRRHRLLYLLIHCDLGRRVDELRHRRLGHGVPDRGGVPFRGAGRPGIWHDDAGSPHAGGSGQLERCEAVRLCALRPPHHSRGSRCTRTQPDSRARPGRHG